MTVQRGKDTYGFWHYKTIEVKGVSPDVLKWEKRILRRLVLSPESKFTSEQLRECLQITDASSALFNIALERLSDSYQIMEDFDDEIRRVYWVSASSAWVSSTFASAALAQEIEDAEKLLQCQTASDVLSLTSNWKVKDPSHKQKVWELLTPTERNAIRSLLNPPAFNEGDWVRNVETQEPFKITEKRWHPDEGWFYEVEGKAEIFAENCFEKHPDYEDSRSLSLIETNF
jgi:hypothetical protein